MSLTERQRIFRAQGLGGSDIANLVSGRALDVWLDKLGRSEFAGNHYTEWGQRLEGPLLEKFGEDHGVVLLHPRDVWRDSVDGTLRHPEHSIALATPDGVVCEDLAPVHLVQAKCVGTWNASTAGWGESGSCEIPSEKLAQCIWECFVSGVHSATLAVLIGGNDYREYPIEYDAELASLLLEEAERFWQYVVTDTQPPIGESVSATAYLKKRFPRNDGRVLPAPAGLRDLAVEYDQRRAEEKAAKEAKEAAGNRLRELIGDADGFEAPGLKVTSKLQNGSPNYRLVAEQLGASKELIAKHTPSHRVLHVAVKE